MKLELTKYTCPRCNHIWYENDEENDHNYPEHCPDCQGPINKSMSEKLLFSGWIGEEGRSGKDV